MTRDQAQKMYDRLGSASRVGEILGVSKAYAHVLLKKLGVKIKPRGCPKGYRKPLAEAPQRRQICARITERRPCPRGRNWGGKVVSCGNADDSQCEICTRGEDFARFEVLHSSKGFADLPIAVNED